MTVTSRGTSNTNDRGNSEQRRRRKRWLFEIWAADVDVVTREEFFELRRACNEETDVPFGGWGTWSFGWQDGWIVVTKGLGRPAVRCFRCGRLCDWDSVEADRIIPGAEKTKEFPNGGRYTKRNIRPVCGGCNKILAGEWVKRRNAKRRARNQRRRDLKRKCGSCGAVPAAGHASVTAGGKETWYCHPDEGVSCYDGSTA